jgi:hypothetical protein
MCKGHSSFIVLTGLTLTVLFHKVENQVQAIDDLQALLGFCVQGFMPGTSLVPSHLELNKKKLRSYLNWALKIHSRGQFA